MTLAKKTFYLSSTVLLAGAMGLAQTAIGGSSQDQDSSMAGQAAGAKLRGCLSGSSDNYTLTDHSGTIYHLVGGGAQLQNEVGHEVEVTGTPDARRTGASDDTTTNTASSFQVTDAREIGARCDHGAASTGTMDHNPPMTERPPMTDQQPKGAPGEGRPPQPQQEPEPHLVAMLQQPASTDGGNSASQSSTTSPATSPAATESQSNGSMANTPVTSQTPAEPASPVGSNSQLGNGATNPSAVSTQPAQTGTPATTGQAGASATTGSNPTPGTNGTTPGANATSGTTAHPDMNASPAASTSTGAATSPQSTQNDQNKPLYERQATDVPWANRSGSTTTTNPNGSSTTTTTPEPHR